MNERRTRKRTKTVIQVQIKGADARGVLFEEQVQTVNISEHGLCLLTRRELSHAEPLTVVVPGYGVVRHGGSTRSDFVAHALVAYVFKEGEMNRVGLRLVGATLPVEAVPA